MHFEILLNLDSHCLPPPTNPGDGQPNVICFDISKAFDRVWHVSLIYKLKRCGVSGQFLSLVQSFLKDRKQRIMLIVKMCSNCGDVLAGVPQASILGPLFSLCTLMALLLIGNVKLSFLLMIHPCLRLSKSLTQLLTT